MYQRMPPGGMPHRQQLSKPPGDRGYKAAGTGRSGLQAGCLMAEWILGCHGSRFGGFIYVWYCWLCRRQAGGKVFD